MGFGGCVVGGFGGGVINDKCGQLVSRYAAVNSQNCDHKSVLICSEAASPPYYLVDL